MKIKKFKINWPNGSHSYCSEDSSWIQEAIKAGISIPTGCMTGSCGACEIEVNGRTIRACISSIEASNADEIDVVFATDPYW